MKLFRRWFASALDTIFELMVAFLFFIGSFFIFRFITAYHTYQSDDYIFWIFLINYIGVKTLLTAVFPLYTNGQTIGKMIMRLKIVSTNDKEITFFRLFLREVLLEFIAAFGIFGLIVLLASRSTKPYRFTHDLALNTDVVNYK